MNFKVTLLWFAAMNAHASAEEPIIKSVSVGNGYGCAVAEDEQGSYLSCFGGERAPKKLFSYKNPKEVQASDDATCIIADDGVICEMLGTNQLSFPIAKSQAPKGLSTDGFYLFCASEQLGINCWNVYEESPHQIYFNYTADEIVAEGPNSKPCFRNNATWTCIGMDLDQSVSDGTQLVNARSRVCTLNHQLGLQCSKGEVPYLEHPSHIFKYGQNLIAVDEFGTWFIADNKKYDAQVYLRNIPFRNAILIASPQTNPSVANRDSIVCVSNGRGLTCNGRRLFNNGLAKPPQLTKVPGNLVMGIGPSRCVKLDNEQICWGDVS